MYFRVLNHKVARAQKINLQLAEFQQLKLSLDFPSELKIRGCLFIRSEDLI